MKKALTILMLTLSLATFAQNATKVVILDTYNKGGKVRQYVLTEVKTNLAQAISDMRGFEGIVNDKVDRQLLAEGFAEHPRLSEEQAERVANLSGTQYALMSTASIELYGDLSLQIILIDLDAYQVVASESIIMNDRIEDVHKGCEVLVKKISVYLPEPQEPVAENETEQTEQPLNTTKPPTKQGNTEAPRTYAMPLEPQQLTRLEADQVSRHLNRADVCIEMNYIDNAIKEYNEIVKIAPGWANVYMYLGNTYTLKGDDASLKLAVECYDIFMQLTDDQSLYYEAQDKLSRVEMMNELKGKEDANAENLVGTWKSEIHNKYTGQPWFVIDISKTPITNKYQIVLSPKSMMYSNIVNTKAYSEVIDGQINWSYTFQETYVPSQSKYNMQGAMINYLYEAGSLSSILGNVMVENARANDVGYTNILDFNFIADVNIKDIKDDYYKSDKYLESSCQMKGEHHQYGQNNVEMDTVRKCSFFNGDERYPVFEKISKRGAFYYYGDIKITNDNLKLIGDFSPYISQEEWVNKVKSFNTKFVLEGVLIGLSVGAVIVGKGINAHNKKLGKETVFDSNYFVLTGVATGVFSIMGIISIVRWNSYVERCYTTHNKQVDENIRKYSQRDQANISVNVGLTPMGAEISVNF